jgi:protein TonB
MKILIAIVFSLATLSCSSINSKYAQEQVEVLEGAIPDKIVNPRYPRQAALDGVEGYVKFRFDIAANGSIKNLKMLDSVPSGVFDAVATYSIRQWRFKTAQKNGVPVEQKDMVYTMQFQMGE